MAALPFDVAATLIQKRVRGRRTRQRYLSQQLAFLVERPSLKPRPSLRRFSSSSSRSRNLLLQHPLERYIGEPTDSTPFNLARVPLALVGLSDSRDGSKLDEINPYAAFGELFNSDKPSYLNERVKQKVLLCGDQALTVRAALYKCYALTHDDVVTAEQLHVIRTLTSKQGPAFKDMSFGERVRSSLLAARPFFAGTAKGTLDWAARRRHRFPSHTLAAWKMIDEFGRSYGNTLWVCNPLAGYFVFLAILLESRWQALCTSWAVIVSSIFCRAIGCKLKPVLNLGLVQVLWPPAPSSPLPPPLAPHSTHVRPEHAPPPHPPAVLLRD